MKGAQYRLNGLYIKIGVLNKVFKFVNNAWVKHEISAQELLDKAEKVKKARYEEKDIDYDFEVL